MIVVNIRRSGESAVTEEQLVGSAAGDWVISEAAVEEHGDVLLAVRRNQVVGAFDIGDCVEVAGGRKRFTLSPSEEYAGLIGQPSPVTWRRGQANPVQVLDTPPPPDAAQQAVRHTGSAAGSAAGTGPAKPRRAVHRITLETKGLSDLDAARLHHALTTMTASTGHLHTVRTTSLVREMRQAREDADYDYRSMASPTAQRD